MKSAKFKYVVGLVVVAVAVVAAYNFKKSNQAQAGNEKLTTMVFGGKAQEMPKIDEMYKKYTTPANTPEK